MDPIGLTVNASSILFGFLFTGFWWALNRELKFNDKERHLQPAYLLLFLTMGLLAFFGILRPLNAAVARPASSSPSLPSGTVLGLIAVFVGVLGYMLTAFAHYSVFQYPKYKTKLETVVFGVFFVGLITISIFALR